MTAAVSWLHVATSLPAIVAYIVVALCAVERWIARAEREGR